MKKVLTLFVASLAFAVAQSAIGTPAQTPKVAPTKTSSGSSSTPKTTGKTGAGPKTPSGAKVKAVIKK